VHEMLIVRGVFTTRRQIMRRSSGGSLGNWWKVVVRAEDETSGGDWVGCKEAILTAEDTFFLKWETSLFQEEYLEFGEASGAAGCCWKSLSLWWEPSADVDEGG